MKQTVYLLVFALIATCSLSWAADSDFEMAITVGEATISGAPNSVASGEIPFEITFTSHIEEVTGWSLGVKVEPEEGVTMAITSVGSTAELDVVNNGAAPGFFSYKAFDADQAALAANCANGECDGITASGFTQGIVIDMMMTYTLPIGTIAVSQGTVQIEGTVVDADPETCEPLATPLTGSLVFTDELGDPATATLAVYGGNSFPPAVQTPATITIVPSCKVQPAEFAVLAGEGGSGAEGGVPEDLVKLNFAGIGGTKAAGEIQGWSYGLCIADGSLLAIVEAVLGDDTATCNEGGPPGFDNLKIYDGQGLTHGVVVDMMSQVYVDAQNDWEDLVITYEILMTEEGQSTYVYPCSRVLGDPATPNVMVVDGNSIPGSTYENPDDELEDPESPGNNRIASFVFVPGVQVIPGNTNGDGRLDLADGIAILTHLFRNEGGETLPCELAADANGDCAIDVSDAIYLIYYVLQPNIDGFPFPAPVFGDGVTLITPDVCPELTCMEEQG